MWQRVWGRSWVGAAMLMGVTAHAQMHKVEKPEQVTRSIGVYEWTGELKKPEAARLIPVSLFIEGHFEDGGLYLARPVPWTLESGDEYSIETAGQSHGLFAVEYARKVVTRRSAADEDVTGAWYGYGTFEVPKPPKKSDLKASKVNGVVVDSAASDDDQPHLTRRAGAEDDGKSPAASSSKSDAKSGGPTLGRRGDASPTTDAGESPAPPDDPDRPTLRHRDLKPETKGKKQKAGGEVIPMGTSLNDDPERPTMRRGVPAEQFVPKALAGLPPNLHQAVAVSDNSKDEAHVFTRDWESSDERAETLKAMQALARPIVVAYLAKNKLQAVAVVATVSAPAAKAGPSFASTPKAAAAKPATTAAGRRKVAAPAPVVAAFTSEELKGYELTYGGLPTFVYTAEVPVATSGPVYVTLVAQRLPSGELQVALSNVTDATHLNRTPWLRLVDVVDPDASHRGSFLMELRAQSSRQFALYRLVTAKAEQEFVTGVLD
ncbi:hypothetical protein [Granulicella paludicola]|uniref:hypothetical protein n=1 Tax=Granulicella paludicola TaxID=474951 RepID=UPI0021DF85D6|nr:hypothetical protein [Granulicella paludicola]